MIKKLGRALRDLPESYDLLRYFREAGSRSSAFDGVRSAASDPHRSVCDLEVVFLTDVRDKANADLYPASDHRLGVLPALSRWVRFIDEELIKAAKDYDPPYRFIACCGSCRFLEIADSVLPWSACCSGRRMTHWEPKTVATECAWLHDQMDFIGDQAWLHKMYQEITGLLGDITKIIGREAKTEYVCINCGWSVTPRYSGQAYVCTGCGRTWGWPELRNMAERARPITIKEAAEMSGASIRLLKSYITKGKITALEQKRGRAKLYDLAEVMSATVDLRYKKTAKVAS